MILAIDVDYQESKAIAAGVLIERWGDCTPVDELIAPIAVVAEYEPGQFYKRELPCILELLKLLEQLPEYIIIDGHVYLDRNRKPGLGMHLYAALQERSVIIGVAKSRFKDTPGEAAVLRGDSRRALYVTAAGIDEADARRYIIQMCGEHRIPTVLKRADQLCRGLVSPESS